MNEQLKVKCTYVTSVTAWTEFLKSYEPKLNFNF